MCTEKRKGFESSGLLRAILAESGTRSLYGAIDSRSSIKQYYFNRFKLRQNSVSPVRADWSSAAGNSDMSRSAGFILLHGPQWTSRYSLLEQVGASQLLAHRLFRDWSP
jgi:hypothetical protein